MLFFNKDNQENTVLNYLPKGRIFKQARIIGSAFNKIIKWKAKFFEDLVETYNETFKGLFICESTFLIEQHKKDYSIPNEIFYQTTVEEHRQDIIVLKYLMSGNQKFHFEAIAKVYGICVVATAGSEYLKNTRLPHKIPHKLISGYINPRNILIIQVFSDSVDVLPHKVPHILGSGLKIEKLKKIYAKIKPAQTKIIYVSELAEDADCKEIKICVKGL